MLLVLSFSRYPSTGISVFPVLYSVGPSARNAKPNKYKFRRALGR